MCDATTLLAIQCKASPIPFGQSPGSLSNDINLHAGNVSNNDAKSSVVQSFFMTAASVLQKLFRLLPNWFDVSVFF